MSEEALRNLVASLRSELAHAHDLDPNSREVLHSLVREVEAALQDPSAESRDMELPWRERFADFLTELEVSHPKLSRTVGNVVDTLAFYNL
jgi:hypothetical protein